MNTLFINEFNNTTTEQSPVLQVFKLDADSCLISDTVRQIIYAVRLKKNSFGKNIRT